MDFNDQEEYTRFKAAGDKLVARIRDWNRKHGKNAIDDKPVSYFVYSRYEDNIDRQPIGIGIMLQNPLDVDIIMDCADADGAIDGVPILLSFDVTIKADTVKDRDIVREMMSADCGAHRAGILSSPYEDLY